MLGEAVTDEHRRRAKRRYVAQRGFQERPERALPGQSRQGAAVGKVALLPRRQLRGPLRQRVRNAVLGPVLMDSGYFNPRFLREMVDEHQSGARDYGVSLWSLLMFEAFLRKVMGARSAEKFKVA